MAQLIGCLIAGYFCLWLPYKHSKEEEARKRREMYNGLNKQSHDEMEKWRK